MNRKTRQRKAPDCESTCKCSLHTFCLDKYKTEVSRTYNVKSSHDYNKSSLKQLISEGVMGARATYVCDVCLRHGKFLLTDSEESYCTDPADADVDMT